jgi:hypothetical protein
MIPRERRRGLYRTESALGGRHQERMSYWFTDAEYAQHHARLDAEQAGRQADSALATEAVIVDLLRALLVEIRGLRSDASAARVARLAAPTPIQPVTPTRPTSPRPRAIRDARAIHLGEVQ